jgi:tetratricopeptide (TPR) repeat protein
MNHLLMGNFDEAITVSQEALELARKIFNRWNEAFVQAWIGEAYIERGDIATAERVMKAAIEMGERVFPPTLVITRSDLTHLYADLGAVDEAIELGRQALRAAETRVVALRPWAAGSLAHAYLAAGDHERARELVQYIPDIQQSGSNPRYWVRAARARMDLARAEGDFALALRTGDSLLGYLKENKLRQYLGDALRVRGQILMDMGAPERARADLEEARRLAEEMGAQWSLWQALAALSRLEAKCGNGETAHTLGEQVRTLVESIAERTPETLRAGFRERALSEL